jgi:hypothetical protein
MWRVVKPIQCVGPTVAALLLVSEGQVDQFMCCYLVTRFYTVYCLHCDVNNSRNTNWCTILWFMGTMFYIAPTCFGAIMSPSPGSWHQNFFKTHSNKIDHNTHAYVVVSLVHNFTRTIFNHFKNKLYYHCFTNNIIIFMYIILTCTIFNHFKKSHIITTLPTLYYLYAHTFNPYKF